MTHFSVRYGLVVAGNQQHYQSPPEDTREQRTVFLCTHMTSKIQRFRVQGKIFMLNNLAYQRLSSEEMSLISHFER